MKLDDIVKLLADKINQSHYIKHYLNIVFINGFKEGNQQKEDFAIGFADWIPYNAYKESSCWRMYDKKDNEYTIQELINEYEKQVEL